MGRTLHRDPPRPRDHVTPPLLYPLIGRWTAGGLEPDSGCRSRRIPTLDQSSIMPSSIFRNTSRQTEGAEFVYADFLEQQLLRLQVLALSYRAQKLTYGRAWILCLQGGCLGLLVSHLFLHINILTCLQSLKDRRESRAQAGGCKLKCRLQWHFSMDCKHGALKLTD